MFEYYGDIQVYCPGVGAYEPLWSIFLSESLIVSPLAHFLKTFTLNDILKVSPFKCIGDLC